MLAIPGGKLTDEIGKYVALKVGMTRPLTPGMFTAFAIVDDSKNLVAGVVITEFRGTDCEIICAGESAMAWRPHVCKAVFSYIFNQLGCVRCTSITLKGNTRARRFLEGLGFCLEGNLRLGYDGKRDALIYGLLGSECRYLADESEEKRSGKKVRSSSPRRARSAGNSGGAGADEQGYGGSAS